MKRKRWCRRKENKGSRGEGNRFKACLTTKTLIHKNLIRANTLLKTAFFSFDCRSGWTLDMTVMLRREMRIKLTNFWVKNKKYKRNHLIECMIQAIIFYIYHENFKEVHLTLMMINQAKINRTLNFTVFLHIYIFLTVKSLEYSKIFHCLPKIFE